MTTNLLLWLRDMSYYAGLRGLTGVRTVYRREEEKKEEAQEEEEEGSRQGAE